MSHKRTVGIFIFDAVEVLDFCGPFEVFSVARPAGEVEDDARLFRVVTIAETAGTVSCRGDLLVEPHHTIADHPPLDILVVPGGKGTRRELDNPAVLAWIAAQAAQIELTTSVCTGAFLLAKNGLLDGRAATTHWASIAWLRDNFPAVDVRDDARFVDAGKVVTSAGVSAGIDMALRLAQREAGDDIAEAIQLIIEYSPEPPFASGSEPLAASRIVDLARELTPG